MDAVYLASCETFGMSTNELLYCRWSSPLWKGYVIAERLPRVESLQKPTQASSFEQRWGRKIEGFDLMQIIYAIVAVELDSDLFASAAIQATLSE